MHFPRWLLISALAASLAGCSRDPLDATVAVPTAKRFAAWRAQVDTDSGVETRRQVGLALQEIRQHATGERELKRALGEAVRSGTEEIDATVRQRVDGKSLREVVQLGVELRIRRLTEELAGLEDAIKKNGMLVTRPGDTASKRHLDELNGRQVARVQKYREDIAAAEKELAPLLARTGRRLIDPAPEKPTDTPDTMPQRVKKV